MQNLQHETKKQDGSYEFIDNKLRIKHGNGVDSVLFEDISSISYKEVSLLNNKASLICTFIGCILFVYGILVSTNMIVFYLGFVTIVIGFVLMFVLKTYFDNVIIETRGGKFLFYSVEHEKGSDQMDAIENERRKQGLV